MAARPPIVPLFSLTKFQILPKIPGFAAPSAGVGAPPAGVAPSATGFSAGIDAPPAPTVGAAGPGVPSGFAAGASGVLVAGTSGVLVAGASAGASGVPVAGASAGVPAAGASAAGAPADCFCTKPANCLSAFINCCQTRNLFFPPVAL